MAWARYTSDKSESSRGGLSVATYEASYRSEALSHGACARCGRYLLCADAAIDFKIGEEDFLEKIPDFGSITEVSTYASRTFARGPALGVSKIGNLSYVWVYACDKDGARRSEGAACVLVGC